MRGGAQWLRVLFFGTDSFALPTLRALVEDMSSVHTTRIIDHVQVACPPALTRGSRRKKEETHAVRDYCAANHIHVHDCPPQDNDWEGFIASLAPQFDVGVVASFGHILPDSMIDHFRLAALNVHPSLLPKYRGPAPLHHTILNGDTKSGVSIIEVSKRTVDVGKVLLQEELEVPHHWFLEDLRSHTADLGAQMMLQVLADLSHYQQHAVPQNQLPYPSSYAGKRFKKHAHIDWHTATQADIANRFRCFANNLGLHTTVNERPVTLTSLGNVPDRDISHAVAAFSKDAAHRADFGTDTHVPGTGLPVAGGKAVLVRCMDGYVPVTKVQFPTRRPISIKQLYHQLGLARTMPLKFG